MKLHLPLPLRSALLAACAVGITSHISHADDDECNASGTNGNPYLGPSKLTEDLIYKSGTKEQYQHHHNANHPAGHWVHDTLAADYPTSDAYRHSYSRSIHSFSVNYHCDNMSGSGQHGLGSEVNITLDGDNRQYSYQVTLDVEDGNVAWIIPYDRATVKMEHMKDVLISGTTYADEYISGKPDGDQLPWHESCGTLTTSNSYKNCIDITISDSNSFTFEKGDYARTSDRLGALTTEGSLILTNVGQVALTDNIGTVLMGSKFSMTEGESAVFSRNSLHVFDHSEVSLTNVSKVEFKNNKDSVFYTTANYGSAPYDTSMTFTNCGEVVFSGNEAEDGVIVGRPTEVSPDQFMLFENCDTVTVEQNHAKEKRLFVTHQPKFKGCTNVTLANNQADHGEVFGRQLNFEEIKSSIKINDNISAAADSNGTYGYLVTGNNRGEIIASGVAGQTAAMEIKGNSGTGNFRGMANGRIEASSLASLSICNNTLKSSINIYAGKALSMLLLDNIKTISIKGNIMGFMDAAGGTDNIKGGFYRSALTGEEESTISNFDTLEIADNVLGYAVNGKGSADTSTITAKKAEALLTRAIINGKTDGSLTSIVKISGNKLASAPEGEESLVNSHYLKLNNLAEFDLIDNKTENIHMLFGNIDANNVRDLVIQGNKMRLDSTGKYAMHAVARVRDWTQAAGSTKLLFENNSVVNEGSAAVYGAVLFLYRNSDFAFNSASITFSGNKAVGNAGVKGAGIYVHYGNYGDNVLSLSGNSINIQNNGIESKAAATTKNLEVWGGAIYTAGSVELSGSSTLSLTGNYAKATNMAFLTGGAIYADSLNIHDNDDVEIRGNYLTDGTTVQLNAVTTKQHAILNALSGKTVNVYDSLNIGGVLYINGDATTKKQLTTAGAAPTYSGTVTLSGVHAREDLEKIKQAANAGEVTDDEVTISQTYTATEVAVCGGTLALDHVFLEVSDENGIWTPTYTDEVAGAAKLDLKDSSITLTHDDTATATMTNASFSGENHISFTGKGDLEKYKTVQATGGEWTFYVDETNKSTELLSIENAKLILKDQGITFAFGNKLAQGEYRILSYDLKAKDVVDWSQVTFTGSNSDHLVDNKDEGDVYLLTDDDQVTLIFGYDGSKIMARDNTTLTWNSGSPTGTWKVGTGNEDSYWTVTDEEVEDKNFYTGDAVEFKSAAGVTIEGTVRPGSVLVENGAGQDVTFSGSGQITDVDIPSKKVTLTKKGEGKLTINTENAYTGGTVLEAGELVAGEANALGLGAVTVSGGTLDMGGNALSNDVVVSKDSAINNAGSFAGKLTVEDGTLSGDAINLAKGKSAELKGGTVGNVLAGAGGVTVSGNVTLSGANTYSGGTTVQSGTLTVGGSGQLGSGVVTLSGGSLDMGSNALTNEVVVSKDATVNNAGSFAGKLTVEDGTLSGDAINLAEDAQLKGGTVGNVLTGDGGVTVSGDVTLSGENTYTGTTTVEKGTLTVNRSIAGTVINVEKEATYKGAMSGKTLTLGGTVVGDVDGGSATVTGTLNGNFTDGTLTLNGGKVQGSVTLGTSGQMTVNGANSTVGGTITLNSGGKLTLEAGSGLTAGTLTLSGGTLDLSDALGALTVTTFTSTAESVLDVGDLANMEVGDHTIFSYTTASGADESHLKLQGLDSVWSRKTFTLQKQAKALVLNVSGEVADLTWPSSGGTWSAQESGGEWTVAKEDMDKHFFNGDNVTFEDADNVPIDGEVNPGSITVKGNSDTTFKSADGKTGALTGTGKLTKEGEGKLTIETDNSKYSGDVEVKGGTLTVGEDASLGSGTVTLSGGSLDMGGNELANDVVVSQDAKLDNAGSFAGNLTVEGGTLEGNVNLAEGKSAELKGGTVEGNLTGDGSVTVSGDVTLSGTNDYTGGTTVKSGELTVDGSLSSDVELQGGSLNVGGSASVTGDVTVQKGASVTVESGGTLDGNLTLEKGASLSSDDGLTVKEKQTFTLSGGTLTSDVTLEDGGTLAVEGSDQSIQGDLTLSGGTVEMGSHNPLAVKGDLTIDGETDVMLDSSIDLSAAEGQELFTYTGTLTGDVNNLDLSETLGDARGKVTNDEAKKVVALELYHATLTWDNGSTATWTNDRDHQWDSEESDKSFHQLDNVVFDGAGDVPIEGEVKPGAIEVKGDDDTIFQNAEGKTGSIAGKAKLTKEGKGTLTINTDNKNYAGEIEVKGGTLKAGHKNAFGSGSVSITNATFDGGDFAVKNPVVLSGASSIKGASSAKKITFADGAQISGLDGYKLSTGNSLTIGSGGSSYSGSITFDGGQLSLTGGVFDLTGADIDFTGETSVLDLRDWAGLDYGHEYKLMDTQGLSKKTRAVAEEDDEQDVWEERFTTVLSNKSLERLSHLEERDGDVYLVIERPSENPTVTAALKPNHRHAYQTLAKIAHLGTATGSLATLAEEITATDDPDVARAMLTRLSGEELATAITAQTEGNLAHLRRLRGAVGSGQAITASGKVGAYITSYSELSTMDQDAQGSGFHRTEIGGSFGLEASIVDKSVVGVALSAGRAYVSPSAPAGRYHEDTTREDLYVVADFGVVRSTTTVGLGEHEFDIRRTLPNGMVSAAQDMKGNSVNFSEELAISLSSDESGSFETFFSMESSYNRIDSFVEKGADTASISVDSHDSWATDFSLGLRANFLFSAFSGAPSAVFSMQAAVVASVGDTVTDVTMRYVGAPDLPYTTRSAKRNRWGYNLGAALTLPVTANAALFGSAEAILRGDSREATATVGLKLNF